MTKILTQWWQVLRELADDDAYERYCAHHRHQHADQPMMNRRAYYLMNQQKKWTGINRCC